MVYYLSMEFLMGRALGNNIINLQAYKAVAEALEELALVYHRILDRIGYSLENLLIRCFLKGLSVKRPYIIQNTSLKKLCINSKVAFWRLHNSQNRIQSDFTCGIVTD